MKRSRKAKDRLNIPKFGHIRAFVVIVDLNQFTAMVSKAEEDGDSMGFSWPALLRLDGGRLRQSILQKAFTGGL